MIFHKTALAAAVLLLSAVSANASLISVDVSASIAGPQRVRGFVVGLNHEFSRR